MLTIKEAAEQAGVDPETVRRWVREGKLKAEKGQEGLAKKWLIDPKDLDAMIVPTLQAALSISKLVLEGERLLGVEGDHLSFVKRSKVWLGTLFLTLRQGSPAITRILSLLPEPDASGHVSRPAPFPISLGVMDFSLRGEGIIVNLGDWVDWEPEGDSLVRTFKIEIRSNTAPKKISDLPVVKIETLYNLPLMDHRRLLWLRRKHPERTAALESEAQDHLCEAITALYDEVTKELE